MKPKAIALLSGGLDSTVATLVCRCDYDVTLGITFDYGQRAARQEIDSAGFLCARFGVEHRVIGLPWLKDATKTALVDPKANIPTVSAEVLEEDAASRASKVWVPNRNGVFVAIAAAIAESSGCDVIIAGFNAEEAAAFPDNSAPFVDATNAALGLSTLTRVRVVSPTLLLTKEEIAGQYAKSKLDSGMFWCCYNGGDKLCGRCESCARAIRAFKKCGAWNTVRRRFE